MANALAGRLYEASGGEDYYTIGTAADIQYSATGGSDDWARGVAGIKWVYLIELPGKGTGFLLPPRYSGAFEQVGKLESVCADNLWTSATILDEDNFLNTSLANRFIIDCSALQSKMSPDTKLSINVRVCCECVTWRLCKL